MTNPIESTVQTSDNKSIHIKKWVPDGPPKAQLVHIHGYLEHCGRSYFSELGEALVAEGIAYTAFDCRGHGKSTGQRAYCWWFKDYHLDLEAVLATTDALVPLFVLGHSGGGVILLDYILQSKPQTFKGIIITSPFLAPAERIATWKIWASQLLAWVAPFLNVPAEEVSPEVLTHDKAKIKEHHEDTLMLHDATIGWGYGVLKTQAALMASDKTVTMPVFFSFAQDDKIADPEVNRQFAQDLQSPDKFIDERKGKFHEILNETDRAELFVMIRKWVLEHIK